MATLTIHNIPDDLLQKLERSANENRRTVDQEAVLWLSRVEVPETPEPQSVEDRIKGFRKLRDKYPDVYITDEQITRGKREGRLGDGEDDPYRIIPPKPTDPTTPEHRLESNTSESSREPDPWLEIARKHRESMPDVYIGDEEELNRFKREGRL